MFCSARCGASQELGKKLYEIQEHSSLVHSVMISRPAPHLKVMPVLVTVRLLVLSHVCVHTQTTCDHSTFDTVLSKSITICHVCMSYTVGVASWLYEVVGSSIGYVYPIFWSKNKDCRGIRRKSSDERIECTQRTSKSGLYS